MNGAFLRVPASRKIHRRREDVDLNMTVRRFQQLQVRVFRVRTRRLFYRAITVIIPFVLAAANR